MTAPPSLPGNECDESTDLSEPMNLTLQLAQRLSDLSERDNDPRFTRTKSALHHCMIPEADDTWRWRCGIRALCGYCGSIGATIKGRALETAAAPHTRALLTRTVVASAILEGHRALVKAKRAQDRSSAWREDFTWGRGQVEIVRTRDDDAWLVHDHSIGVMRSTTIDHAKHARTWGRLIGAEGLTGSFDAKVITEGTTDRHGGTFPGQARTLRHEEDHQGVACALRRRAHRVRAHRAAPEARSVSRAPMRHALRSLGEGRVTR